MMQAANTLELHHLALIWWLYPASFRRVLIQGEVSSSLIVIIHIAPEGIDKLTSSVIRMWEYHSCFDYKTRSEWALAPPYRTSRFLSGSASPRQQVNLSIPKIVVSDIFKWFKKNFMNDLRHRGLPSERGLIDYIASVALEPLRIEIERSAEYKIVFHEYDWSINEAD